MTVFTQKHYEYLEREIAQDSASPEAKQRATEILCRVLKRDNPRFKREVFVSRVLGKRRES